MKALILVKAPANHGKSSSLKILISHLFEDETFRLIYPLSKDEVKSFIIGEIDKRKIGVITFGDPGCWDNLKSCLNTCVKHECDIIVVASRVKGEIYINLCAFGEGEDAEIIETSPIFIRNYESSGLDAELFNSMTVSTIHNLLTSSIINI